jgi:hypothetical protein
MPPAATKRSQAMMRTRTEQPICSAYGSAAIKNCGVQMRLFMFPAVQSEPDDKRTHIPSS